MFRNTLRLCAIALFAIGTVAHAETVAKVVAASGSASASGRAISTGSDIAEHDKITVGGGGNVQLLFTDGTKLVVGPNSTLVIEKYLMQGGGTAKEVSVDALRGTFRFITGRSAKSAYDIKTANSTIGIRGTAFDFWVGRETGVVVLHGSVGLCSAGNCVNIAQGCNAGIAQPGSAQKLSGKAQGTAMRSHLPYVVNQAPLRAQFQLPVRECRSTLNLASAVPLAPIPLILKESGSHDKAASPPPPPPPPPPSPPKPPPANP